MRKERVGFAICGSFHLYERALDELRELVKIYETVIPIASEAAAWTDTPFGTAESLLRRMEELTDETVITEIAATEPIGPKNLLDVLVIAPCTGNTLAKLANGITDTTVTVAARSHLRNSRPVVIALASSDGLSFGAKNIGVLLARKNYYFVPFGQDAPRKKPWSLTANFHKLPETVDAALRGEQLQPVLLRE